MSGSDKEHGILYIVATPIGNLEDITARALKILNQVDFIASEDTRVSGKLLARFEIKKCQFSYHDKNERSKSDQLIDLLKDGNSIALISDAGTPLISDPGYHLVKKAIENDIEIIPIPGPSSVITALMVCGFSLISFCFEGYPPKTSGKHRKFFEKFINEERIVVFFETPHRLTKSLNLMLDVLGDREIFIGRELTKRFEEKLRGPISEMISIFENRSPKGEFVIVINGAKAK